MLIFVFTPLIDCLQYFDPESARQSAQVGADRCAGGYFATFADNLAKLSAGAFDAQPQNRGHLSSHDPGFRNDDCDSLGAG